MIRGLGARTPSPWAQDVLATIRRDGPRFTLEEYRAVFELVHAGAARSGEEDQAHSVLLASLAALISTPL